MVLALTACVAVAGEPGTFVGRVAVELVEDIEHDHRLRLLEDFGYRDADGKLWLARKGGIVDGLHRPGERPSWARLVYAGRLRKAAVVHDYFVAEKAQPWLDVHRMYHGATRAEGASAPEAKIEYLLTYASGWRWEPRGSSCYGSCHAGATMLAWKPQLDVDTLRPLVDWIWADAPGLEEIERRADGLISKPGPHLFSQGF